MTRPLVVILILVLAALAAGLGYQLYQERHKPDGVQIEIDKSGVSIQSN